MERILVLIHLPLFGKFQSSSSLISSFIIAPDSSFIIAPENCNGNLNTTAPYHNQIGLQAWKICT